MRKDRGAGVRLEPRREWPRVILGVTLLIAAGLWAYHNSFAGVFLFDDTTDIVMNPAIRRLWPGWDALLKPSTETVLARPVVDLSLALNYALGGLDVRGYHAVNLAVHLLAALVLYGLVRRTLLTEGLRSRFQTSATALALAGALLWVVHPLQTQSVTYIIQRAESLMGLWYLLTLYCALRGAATTHPRRWQAAAAVSCALGMVTKPVMVTAPAMVLLYDWIFLAGSWRLLWRSRRGLYLGLASTWGLLAILALAAPPAAEPMAGFDLQGISPLAYAATQPGVILHYLRLALWPHPLVLDYGWPLAGTTEAIALPAGVTIGLIGLTLWAIRRRLAVGFLGAWWFLILAPTSSVFPIADPAFEHRVYLPLASVITSVVIGSWNLLDRTVPRERVKRQLAVGLMAAATILLGLVTIRRNADYHSDIGMWKDVSAKRPHNARAYDNLGYLMAHRGRLDEAAAYLTDAIRLKPEASEYHNNLGNVLLAQGKTHDATARYATALRLNPRDIVAHSNLANVSERQGDVAQAIAHYTEALRIRPDVPELHSKLAYALASHGDYERAIAHYTEALRLRPGSGEARRNLSAACNNFGVILFRQARLDEAAAQLTAALRVEPGNTDARQNLSAVLRQQGQAAEAARPLKASGE